ncbi:MAG: F0F1 ATP synthase subunit B [Gammaproteobacteria bacterium]|nr:F0F1 ATP synthase subunit B [Gammaproteobacteria bacterium]
MTINATFIGQIIVFLILLWFISKFVTPIVSQTLAERAKKIADGLAAADKGQKDLADATHRADAIIREARERAKQIEDLAARRSSEAIEAAKQDAQAEGARIVQSARDEAATETGRAREELRREYGRLVVAGASRLLEREIDPRTHEKLLDQLASEIGRG